MAIDSGPEPFLRVTVGSPIYTNNDEKIGVVKEIRGRAFKVDGGFWRTYWLGGECVQAAIPDQSVTLNIDKAHLGDSKVTEPPRAA